MIRYFPELIPIFPWKSGPFLPSEGIFSWIQTQKTPAGLGSVPGRCSVHSHSCSLSFPMQALKSSGNSPPGNPQGVLEFLGWDCGIFQAHLIPLPPSQAGFGSFGNSTEFHPRVTSQKILQVIPMKESLFPWILPQNPPSFVLLSNPISN